MNVLAAAQVLPAGDVRVIGGGAARNALATPMSTRMSTFISKLMAHQARRAALPLACLLAGALSLPAQATQPLWELGLGAAWVHLPHYRGSDQAHDWLLPLPYAVYRGKIFRATREGARAVLFESQRLDLDLSVAATAPLKSADNRARAGMPDLAPTVEVGPNLNFTLSQGRNWKLDLRLPVRGVFSVQRDSQALGWTASPVLNLDLRWQEWNVGVQAGPLFGSQSNHAYFYGVAAQHASAARPAYRAEGGYAGSRFTVGASRRLGDFWLGTYVRADSVAGARFEASPLVRQRNNWSAGLALSWIFKVSAERVEIED